MNKKEIIFWFDSETSGFDEKKHQILSFAIVATDIYFNVVGTYYKFVKLNGASEITPEAMSVNKIDLNSEHYLNNSITEDELVLEVLDFVNKHETEKSLFLAHNAPFDKKFLFYVVNKCLVNNPFEFKNFLCTVKYFKKVIGMGLIKTVELLDRNNKPYLSAKLEHIIQALKLTFTAHNALEDTLALIESYKQAIKLEKNQNYFEIYE